MSIIVRTPAIAVRSGWWSRARFLALLWLMMLPSLAGLAVFTYYPNLEAVKYALYKWDGGAVEEFRGLHNFAQIFGGGDPRFWASFSLIGVLLAANLLKMWPSIFVAIVLHRLKSERWQFFYRVLFVIPMVIPGLVGLLLWKGFYDPNVGLFNKLLNGTGLMPALDGLDRGLPQVAAFIEANLLHWNGDSPLWSLLLLPTQIITPLFGGAWGLVASALVLLLLRDGIASVPQRWMLWIPVLGFAAFAWGPNPLVLMIRASVLLGASAALVEWLRRRDPLEGRDRLANLALWTLGIGIALVLLTKTWPTATGAFANGCPSWLGHSKLVVPAVILWGFPWIGTVGVLIYLAGLSNISQEVYEAAELDGIGFWGKIFRIEIPLILTQVRINLIFLTISTLSEYGFFLILLGPDGGPDNAGLTPGLYMYQKAFIDNEMGYACALGMVLFALLLFLTLIYQKHLKVEK
jgi:ABC-type sugar transport system permease subunit